VDRERARASLLGCAVGDALGANLTDGRLPTPPWRWTDDTEMACSVWHVLATAGRIDPDALATSFVRHFDVGRSYGAGAATMLGAARHGADLRALAARAFGGAGSWGNGAAMRVAPIGAWFAGDPVRAAAEAAVSARVTHTHREGVAGAVATAVAAALPGDLAALGQHVPPGQVRDGIATAATMRDATAAEVAAEVGAGGRVSAPDTVPLALWIAARHADDYEQAVWTAAAVAEDVDTVCAMVGAIVAANVGEQGIPARWRESVEPLPDWV
jgi:ADP-ribosylglycohydrolase